MCAPICGRCRLQVIFKLFLALFLACHARFLSLVSNLPHLVAALLSSELMASWISAKVSRVVSVHFRGSSCVVLQGVKSVMKLALSAVISACFLVHLGSLIFVL